jgi:hypothetical protein
MSGVSGHGVGAVAAARYREADIRVGVHDRELTSGDEFVRASAYDALAAYQAQAAGRIQELSDALVKAVDCIRVWHNADVPEKQRSELWDIYWRNAPELTEIRLALSRGGPQL